MQYLQGEQDPNLLTLLLLKLFKFLKFFTYKYLKASMTRLDYWKYLF